MINQFQIGNYTKKQLNEYLTAKGLDLHTAMNDEASNKEVAAILHAGFPKMVQKIYSLAKFEVFFWEKRDLLAVYIVERLAALDKPKKK